MKSNYFTFLNFRNLKINFADENLIRMSPSLKSPQVTMDSQFNNEKLPQFLFMNSNYVRSSQKFGEETSWGNTLHANKEGQDWPNHNSQF